MWFKRIVYTLMFMFCTWLAINTRTNPERYPALIADYGGDVIWAGMFLFFLRIFFVRTTLWKLALICFCLGVADELLQLYHAPWIETIRQTRIGGLLLGFGFLWSDIICYAVGIFLAYVIISLFERMLRGDKRKALQ